MPSVSASDRASRKLRGLLAKLDSASTERAVAPYPPPRPSGAATLSVGPEMG